MSFLPHIPCTRHTVWLALAALHLVLFGGLWAVTGSAVDALVSWFWMALAFLPWWLRSGPRLARERGRPPC
jgi:hypothetical protein